ncbi:MAG: acyltransferase [Sphingobacteriales bacterium]|nr:acyltransferase [Sphingobacteriales bacterium]MBI3718087.1 acyltransferase [Sphingobacteriales bacterium]
MDNLVTERKYYIDWIRVLAFFLLIFFHCAMPFVIFGWEVKNKEQSLALSRLIWWLHQWRLPLLFFISGVGIYFSLEKRSIIKFAGERIVRLFIPLLFAMFFTIPLQVYFEKTQKGLIHQSYSSFYPTVWDMVPYPDGTLTWSHMWFVVYLFVFCMLLLPVFGIFKINFLKKLLEKFSLVLSHPIASCLLVAPFIIYYFTLYLKYPEQQSLLDDWFLFISSLTLVIYGYVLGRSNRFWENCEKYRFIYLAIAIISIIILFYSYWWNMNLPKQKGNSLYIYGVVNSIHTWCLIMALLGFAKRHLNFSNRFLKYVNQAVYPFYILHQTLIVAFGFYVVQWTMPVVLKLLILIILCFGSLWLIYHWIIRPFMLTRILYGLKPKENLSK